MANVFLTRKYVNALSSRLERFAPKGNDTWSFRCILCGDSKKNLYKTRGHIYRKKDEFFYRCFNCGVSTTFEKFLKNNFFDLYQEYKLECFIASKGEVNNFFSKETEIDELLHNMNEANKKLDDFSLKNVVPLVDMKADHIARLYVEKRKIPKESWKYLSYTNDFKALVEKIDPTRAENLSTNEHRLVISTFDQNSILTGIIGRALDNNEQRYIHIKMKRHLSKVFGLDRLKNAKGTFFVFEGPIDSMFFENSLASCDSDLASVHRFYNDIILVFDNQPKNRELVHIIKKSIDLDFRVCLFPGSNPFKDINEMIIGGMLVEDIQKEILENTFEGMRAHMALTQWRKV